MPRAGCFCPKLFFAILRFDVPFCPLASYQSRISKYALFLWPTPSFAWQTNFLDQSGIRRSLITNLLLQIKTNWNTVGIHLVKFLHITNFKLTYLSFFWIFSYILELPKNIYERFFTDLKYDLNANEPMFFGLGQTSKNALNKRK